MDIELNEIYDNNIIMNKIFWLSSRSFLTNNQNKKLLNKEVYYILDYLKNFIDLIKIDFKNKNKLKDIKEYMEMCKVTNLNLYSYIEIELKKENKKVLIFKPIEEIIKLNKEVKKEMKNIKLKMMLIKEYRLKHYYENKFLELKEYIYT